MRPEEVIYDWNVRGHAMSPPMRRVQLHDETLRDGLQSPSVRDPQMEEKREIVRLLSAVGIDSINVGLPGAGPRAVADSKAIVETIRDEGLTLQPTCAARTHPNDIRPVIEITQQTGVPVEAMMFLGSSPIRMYAEAWDEARLERLVRDAMKLAVSEGLPATFVTEDTVRSSPPTLKRLFEAAVDEGATRLVLCDTVGHATTNGVFNLVRWTHDLLVGMGARDRVQIDWHGHNDRGFALPNALYAIEAGADRVHGTILGVGERVGNTQLDLLLVNLKLLGVEDGQVGHLARLTQLVAKACAVEIPPNYPVFGRDAFRTGTGVHAAAVIKSLRQGDDWLSDQVYSGVPASWFGREQEIEIGFMSGMSNVRYWCSHRGLDVSEPCLQAIFERAKSSNAMLTEDEIMGIVAAHTP